MSRLTKAIRNKRFKVKEDKKVQLVVDAKTGDRLEFSVLDCSVNGLRARIKATQPEQYMLETDTILTASKLVWGQTESTLGRLVVRRIQENDGGLDVGFSLIDTTLPLHGELSKYLEQSFDSNDTAFDKELNSDHFSLAHFAESEFTSVDLFSKVHEFAHFHDSWVQNKKYAYQNHRVASKGSRVNLKKPRKSGRSDYIMMGSNDYMGLGAHPQVVEAAKRALDVYGFGSTGSPVTTGQTSLHAELCDKLAKIHQKESAILFNSGYAANIGIITALTRANDLIVADQLCHASIQDGMQMSKATSRFFKHNQPEHLRQILERERENYNGCLVITEGVFSMDGDVAYLDQIYAIAREFNCRIMVDQAHCWGVLGPRGLGVCDKYNLLREVDIIMGTFSKVGGGIGGFALGSQELIDWLRYFARSQMFSVSLPPSNVAAVSKAIDLFVEEPAHLANLRANIKHFVNGLRSIGYNIDPNHESAVIPVVIGDEKLMGDMYQSLLEDGIWCVPIVYPAVGRKNCRFRFTMMATHTVSDLDYAVSCLEKAALKAGFKFVAPANKAA